MQALINELSAAPFNPGSPIGLISFSNFVLGKGRRMNFVLAVLGVQMVNEKRKRGWLSFWAGKIKISIIFL